MATAKKKAAPVAAKGGKWVPPWAKKEGAAKGAATKKAKGGSMKKGKC